MLSISSEIAHVLKIQKHILEVLGNLVSMISSFWDICGKGTFNKYKIKSVKESLFACISEQMSDCISKQRSSFAREILDEKYLILHFLKELQ